MSCARMCSMPRNESGALSPLIAWRVEDFDEEVLNPQAIMVWVYLKEANAVSPILLCAGPLAFRRIEVLLPASGKVLCFANIKRLNEIGAAWQIHQFTEDVHPIYLWEL